MLGKRSLLVVLVLGVSLYMVVAKNPAHPKDKPDNDNSVWTHYEGHLYLVVPDYGFTWQVATTVCSTHNAYLVSINTQQESDFIKELLDKQGVSNPNYNYYTGGYKAYVGGSQTLQWADGTVIGFKDWGRYGHGSSSQRYIMLYCYTESYTGTNKWAWNGASGKQQSGFIYEKRASDDSRRNLRASHNTGMLRRLYIKKWRLYAKK